jgi:hypothetical protein
LNPAMTLHVYEIRPRKVQILHLLRKPCGIKHVVL